MRELRLFKKVEFNKKNGVWEISLISCDWDKDSGFGETMYLHLVNLGWCACDLD
jgi:hypothetical protein